MRTLFACQAMLFLALVLTGCGGGGGGQTVPPPGGGSTELKAAVQASRCALVDVAAVLDGSASTSPGTISYAWSLVRRPDQSTAVLQGADTAQPQLVPDRAGAYELQLVVSDGTRNSSATATVEAVVRSAPIVPPSSLEGVSLQVSPSDGDLAPVSACVPVTVTATSSAAGTVTVSLRRLTGDVGDLEVSPYNVLSPVDEVGLREGSTAPFFQTTASDVAAVADLAGLAPRMHTISIRAFDGAGNRHIVRRRVLLTEAAARLPASIGYLPADSAMLALEHDQLLYSQSFPWDVVRLRDLGSGNERTLGADRAFSNSSWVLSNGFAYATAARPTSPDCLRQCIYEFAPDGTVRNLSNPNPFSTSTEPGSGGRSTDGSPRARGGWVAWFNSRGSVPANGLTVYEQATLGYSEIALPGGATDIAQDFDLAVANGVAYVMFAASTPAGGREVYVWDSASRSSRQLTSGGQQNSFVTAGATRVTWQRPSATTAEATLLGAPLAGGPDVTLGTIRARGRALQADNLIAWHDDTDILRANAGSRTDTVSSGGSRLLALGSGFIAFQEDRDLYTWAGASDSRTLRVRGFGPPSRIANGQLLMQVGTALYRVPL